ncbi:MAG: HAD family hydrolase [Nanobdellota archaeon]
MEAIIFDVDGTLYDKFRQYRPDRRTIDDAHNFFRQEAYKRALDGIADEQATIDELITSYRHHADHISDVLEPALLEEYRHEVLKYGSNGKVFSEGFGTNSNFLSTLISSIDFNDILAPDQELINTIDHLKGKEYKLGIMTTEVFQTVQNVCDSLGLYLGDFVFEDHPCLRGDGGKYPILCANNITRKKPSLEPFEKILAVTGFNPCDVTYVGDIRHKDVDPALSLGMNAVHVNRDAREITRGGYIEMPTVYGLREVF